ncbi:response regulator [Allopontixanthobacter sediminis]|uniref:Response regulator n=1 Tax=Allopontixanthobacter sediminis TaxID=1689985 RepID=A0A845B0X1_9SPHN|nr:response regulator [Allopontixanthobacter sediminis]MXP45383.1 response regulator [Allopontixanthobacter sediminis]
MSDLPVCRQSILVAEDESLIRMLMVDTFEDAGYTVIEVGTGDAGIHILGQGQTIVGLVTDIDMPGDVDGCALARVTRVHYPDAAILVVSGNGEPTPKSLPDGAEFIAKPYDIDDVLRRLEMLLAPATRVGT